MKRLAVITARGGSKRIPRKNIKPFCGKPILAYSVEAALDAGIFHTVMVSTDDEEIAGLARQYGAEVPFFRSEETSNDHAVTAQVLAEVLAEYEKRGQRFDQICCLYPTAPFITGERLRCAMELLTQKQADSVLPVVRFGFPPQRGVTVSDDGYLAYKWPENRNARSQDLEPLYHDAGQFYGLNAESFRKPGTLVMEKTVPLVLRESQVQDIDTEEDWRMAEIKYGMWKERQAGEDGGR